MSDDDDLRALTELGRQLPTTDLDPGRADQIRRAGRARLGHGVPPLALLEPLAIGAMTASYLIWAVLRALDGWR
jgi:hypothetical protein